MDRGEKPRKSARRMPGMCLAMGLAWMSCLWPARPSLAAVTDTVTTPASMATTPMTSEEAAWRRTHPTLRIGVFAGDDWPIEAWAEGRPEGLAVDYARLLAARAGLGVEFRPYSDWAALAFAQPSDIRDVDLLLAQPVTIERQKRFDMLKPFLTTHPVFVVRKGEQKVRSRGDLAEARIVVERRFRAGIADARQRYPKATFLFANDGEQAMDMVARGEADVYVSIALSRALALMHRHQADDLDVVTPADIVVYDLAPAVPKGRPELLAALQRAEATITAQEIDQLRQHWGVASDNNAPIALRNLTVEERNWIASLPTLRVGYEMNRYPYSFVNEQGQFDGLAANYLNVLKEKLGLKLQWVPAADWEALQNLARTHQIDLVAAGSSYDFDTNLMVFSQPFESFPGVLVARTEGASIASIADAAGKTIAIRAEPGMLSLARSLLPASARVVPVGSNEEGLNLVSQGKADAYIGTLPAVDSLIRNRYSDLHVVGPAGMNLDLSMGVSQTYGALTPIVNRVLTGMDPREKQAIRIRWLSADYYYGAPWKWVLTGLGTAILLFAGFGYAYTRLRRAYRARDAAQGELTGQVELQQAMLEALPYPVFVKDEQGRYIAINRAYEDQFGYTRSELLGKTLAQTRHVPNLDADEQHANDLALLRSGTSRRQEVTFTPERHDGAAHSAILWLHPFGSPSSGESRLLGTLVDVSDIRNAEARARASEQRLSDITQAMPAAVFQLRASPDGQRRFTFVAGRTQGVLGESASNVINDEPALFERIHPDDRERVTAEVEATTRSLQPTPAYDFRLLVDDHWRWLRTEGGSPRRLDDGSVEWSGYWIATDEIHAQEEALTKAKKEAEAAASAKSAFLAAMSHEIRTPMAGVIGLIELLGRTPLDKDQASMLAMAQESAKALLQILDDILDYSRMDAKQLHLDTSPCDLRDLIDSVVGLFASRAVEKGVRLYAIQAPDLAHQYHADVNRIRQVLTNLLSNAIKFTSHGSVTLQADVSRSADEIQHIRFTVTDTGIGIAPDNLLRLFSPFTQAEESTSRRFGGTGLGLAISRQLAQMMGGDIQLASEPGTGTTVTFEVPLAVLESARSYGGLKERHALVHCDDEKNDLALRHALSALGFIVATTAGRHQADLVVSDRREDIAEARGSHAILLVEGVARDNDSIPTLRVTPLLWRSIRELCVALFTESSTIDASAPGIQRRRHKEKILVAEDHLINRALVGRQLEALGYAHTVVEDGDAALRALSQDRYDILLTDCHMPRLDGYTLARRIRSHETGAERLPIVALSASALPEDRQRCLDAGMDDFLAKPIQLGELAATLARFASREVSASTVTSVATPEVAHDLYHILTAFNDPQQLDAMLCELLRTCRHDLGELDQLEATDEKGRRFLLHRMEGVLVAIAPSWRDLLTSESGENYARRRQNIVRKLEEVDALLHQLRASKESPAPDATRRTDTHT